MGGVHAPIAVVRMAVDDAYGAREWREEQDGDEIAYRTANISRRTCRAVAEFSFQLAQKSGAKVFGGPKYHRQPGLRRHVQRRAGCRRTGATRRCATTRN